MDAARAAGPPLLFALRLPWTSVCLRPLRRVFGSARQCVLGRRFSPAIVLPAAALAASCDVLSIVRRVEAGVVPPKDGCQSCEHAQPHSARRAKLAGSARARRPMAAKARPKERRTGEAEAEVTPLPSSVG